MTSRRITVSGPCAACDWHATRKFDVNPQRNTTTYADGQAALDEAVADFRAKPVYHKRCDPVDLKRAARRAKWDREICLRPLQEQAGVRLQEAADHNSQHEYQFWTRFRGYLADFIETGDIG